MAANDKDTIYVDIDDEITGIIDKVRNSSAKIVALVLPKRATVFQSVVNMKLLKRSADDAKKHIVLITSEAGLMPLAASTGMYVAKTLQSKPEVPEVTDMGEDEDADEPIVEGPEEEVTTATAGNRPVGELARRSAATSVVGDEVETLDMEDEGEEPTPGADAAPITKKAKGVPKLHIPNFDKFRLRLFLGIFGLIVLGVLWYLAVTVLPKASITVTTDTSSIDSNLTMTLDSTAKSIDPSTLTIPAQVQQAQKNFSQQVPTTGQQNNGQKATGTVDMATSNCSGKAPSVPAGTGISYSGLTYITQTSASFKPQLDSNLNCYYAASGVSIASQSPGTKYNTKISSASVAGYSGITANGSADGGTDNIIKVVAQADIDSASQKISTEDTSSVKQQLEQQLQQAGLFPIVATFAAGTPSTSPSANVGDQADNVTVTENITYTMFGVKQSDLKAIVDNDIKGQIDPSKQSILSEGLDKATFRVITASATGAQVAMSTTATAGPDLTTNAIKQAAAGKKSADIVSTVKSNPGVTDVKVNLSPFWVTAAPSNTGKITVTFVKASGK